VAADRDGDRKDHSISEVSRQQPEPVPAGTTGAEGGGPGGWGTAERVRPETVKREPEDEPSGD
jgi:hypothetical protein